MGGNPEKNGIEGQENTKRRGGKVRSGRRLSILQKTGAAVLAAIAACVVISVTPAYRNDIRQSEISTCYSAMYSFGIWYHLEAQAEINQGTSPDNVDYEAIARDVVKRHFGVDLDAALSSSQICRAGGTWTISIDPDTHRVMIQCTADGHIWYVDSVDEQMMEDFQDMVY